MSLVLKIQIKSIYNSFLSSQATLGFRFEILDWPNPVDILDFKFLSDRTIGNLKSDGTCQKKLTTDNLKSKIISPQSS